MSDLPPVPPVPPASVVVDVSSAWWSKINWTQVVGFGAGLLAVITSNKLQIDPQMQGAIALFFSGVTGLVTVIIRNYYTKTVTPGSLTPEIVLESAMKLKGPL